MKKLLFVAAVIVMLAAASAMLTAGLVLAAEPTAVGTVEVGTITTSYGTYVTNANVDKDALTVEQALQVKVGLELLSKYDAVDKEGKATVGYYRFPPDTLMLIAINIDLGRRLEAQHANANNALIMQKSDGVGTVPEARRGDYSIEYRKLLDAPARVGFYRIKREDLCLEAAPPKCPAANPIPAPVLSLIVPIVER